MSICETMLAEMAEEAQVTRRLFERVPEDKLSWKPHPRSRSLGQLALHIAQIPGNVSAMAAQDVVEAPSFADEPEAKSSHELLQTLDQGLTTAEEILSRMDDQRLRDPWSMRQDGKVLMTVSRAGILRSILLNHYYHHRGQLSVYLRLLAVDSLDSCGVYVGTTGGQVYASADGGDSWASIVRDLPAVLSVEVQTLR